MKVSAFVFVTFLTFTPAVISTANADDHCNGSGCNHHPGTGTAFDIAQQYANGGKFGGVTSGATGMTLDVARDSMRFLGSLDQIASAWRVTPILARGD
jgi:hypothetical protein